MSKQSALNLASGSTAVVAAPALLTPGIEVVPDKAPVADPLAVVVPEPTSTDPNVQALLKKEVRLVKEQEAFKRQQAEWKEKVDRAERLLARDKEFDETRKTDTVAALKMLGLSDTEIFNAVAAGAPREKTNEEIAREAAQEEIKKSEERRAAADREVEQKRNTEVIANFQKSIGTTIETNPDKYEFCKFNGAAAQELIYETVAATLRETKKLLTVTEAADLVESYYEEQAKTMSTLKKLKPKEEPVVEVKAETKRETVVQTKPEAPKVKTITNRMTATSTTGQRSESPSEKRERLAAVLRTGDTTLLRR